MKLTPKLVVYTDRGLAAFRSSRAVVATLEQQARRRLGAERYHQLRGALATFAATAPHE